MEDFKIDGHKLMYHVEPVHNWLNGKDIYPIYVEVAPSGACNHRCIFCGLSYLGYKPRYIKTKYLKKRLLEMSRHGVKSVMYAGEGEPLLHKDIIELIAYTKQTGMDAALTTNGVFLNQKTAGEIMKYLSWLRVSLDASGPLEYAKIHGCSPADFRTAVDNIDRASRIKKGNKYPCTLGVQMVLFKDNAGEALPLARMLKDTGVDYFVIKPYSRHPKNKDTARAAGLAALNNLSAELNKLSGPKFRVFLRENAFHRLNTGKPYKSCLGVSFWSYIDSNADIYACSSYLGDKRFCYGNLYKDSFRKIWQGKKRKETLKMFAEKLDINECRRACRLDQINNYLWELKHPGAHFNFI